MAENINTKPESEALEREYHYPQHKLNVMAISKEEADKKLIEILKKETINNK